MSEFTIISTREEAFKAWDRKKVIIREDGGYFFVYPMLGRGVKYPGFDLRSECNLNTFMSVDKAIRWADEMKYSYAVLR